MKYGLIDFNLTVRSYWESSWNKKALLNIGDAVEYFVVKQLYQSLGISEKDMIPLSISQLITYRGEKLIVAINIALDSYVGYNAILESLSPDIVPVFLGMSFAEKNLNLAQINCLKKYAPVGCRDERSYQLLKSFDIPCYLNGCTASVYRNECTGSDKWKDKIVFIDVPYQACGAVPDSIKNDIVFLSQEKYCREAEMQEGMLPTDWAHAVLQVYASKPRLVVTSRFHGAVLSIANDIPCIVVLEKYTFRFSWIKNWMPIYTENDYDQIDWTVAEQKPDYAQLRELMLRVAKARIANARFEYFDRDCLTCLQENKMQIDESAVSNQVLYYKKVWKEIRQKWRPEREYTFGFWGLNDNAEKLYSLIRTEYPKAKLVSVFDMFKYTMYRGISSEKPIHLSRYKDDESFYVIVTAYLASRVADDVFSESGFPAERSFLCKREFVEPDDLEST